MKDAVTVFEEKEGESGQLPETRRSAIAKIASGFVAVLATNLFEKHAEGSIDRDQGKDFIHTVEINTFGSDPPRISVIYRDEDGSIVDWRWYTTPKQIPRPLGDGRYIALWEDQGSTRVIITPNAPLYRRTLEDIELQERVILPVENRRKLSK